MAYRPTILARDWLITTEHYLSAEGGAAVLRDGATRWMRPWRPFSPSASSTPTC